MSKLTMLTTKPVENECKTVYITAALLQLNTALQCILKILLNTVQCLLSLPKENELPHA